MLGNQSMNYFLCVFVASDAKEQQFWMSQLQACARRHSDSGAKVQHTLEHRVVNVTMVWSRVAAGREVTESGERLSFLLINVMVSKIVQVSFMTSAVVPASGGGHLCSTEKSCLSVCFSPVCESSNVLNFFPSHLKTRFCPAR